MGAGPTVSQHFLIKHIFAVYKMPTFVSIIVTNARLYLVDVILLIDGKPLNKETDLLLLLCLIK